MEEKLAEQLKATEQAYEQERQRWQHEKESYQNLCTWYANTFQYQLGCLLVDALRHPLRCYRLPAALFRLVKRYKRQQTDAKDIESSIPKSDTSAKGMIDLDFLQIENASGKVRQTGIAIIIPVFNAYDELKCCVDSILRNTAAPFQIILINDCSTDSRIEELLSLYKSQRNVMVVTNPRNLGYVKSINVGIQACNTDVVLLNSDTVVTKKWLEKLTIAAYSDERVMTVTPLSNAAGAFSVPEVNADNNLPDRWTLEDMAKLVENQSVHTYERVPTGNGFCMYIKRDAFEHVGLFDEDTFGKGYCEENDFCMRVISKGYENIISDDTYIFHHHTASFGHKKQKLLRKNYEILLSRYPQYDYLVKNMLNSERLESIRQKIKRETAEQLHGISGKRNILYVIHQEKGGSVKTNEDLMGYVCSQGWNVFLLNSNCSTLRLYQLTDGALHQLKKWDLAYKWDINSLYVPEWRNIYYNVLHHCHIDIVHIRHLYMHTFDMIDAANWMNVPCVLSFHDFYYICPTINLVNGKGEYCEADCASSSGRCQMDVSQIKISKNVPKWVAANWRGPVADILGKINAYVTTSAYSRDVYEKIFPSLKGQIRIYEHGRDFLYPREYYGSIPDAGEKIKILLAGNISYNKGAGYISELIDADKEGRLEFHCIGSLPESLKQKVKYYGRYIRDDFRNYAARIRPSYVGVFSIWPETYCHIITEAFSCGLPCVVSDIGTLRERGIKGGCILADLKNPIAAYHTICKISEDRAAYSKLCDEALGQPIRTVADMGKDYMNLYDLLLTEDQDV